MTYDAGTEENNELATHVPGPPFGGSEQAVEGGVIMAHPGITGNADVGMEFGWMEPVARLRVAPYVAPPEEEMASFSMMLDKGLNMISLAADAGRSVHCPNVRGGSRRHRRH